MYDNQFPGITKPPNIMDEADTVYTETEIKINIICRKCGTPWSRMGVKCPAPNCGSKKFIKEIKPTPVLLQFPEY